MIEEVESPTSLELFLCIYKEKIERFKLGFSRHSAREKSVGDDLMKECRIFARNN